MTTPTVTSTVRRAPGSIRPLRGGRPPRRVRGFVTRRCRPVLGVGVDAGRGDGECARTVARTLTC